MGVLRAKDTDKRKICLKSGKEEERVKWLPPTENVLIGFRRHWGGRRGKWRGRRNEWSPLGDWKQRPSPN